MLHANFYTGIEYGILKNRISFGAVNRLTFNNKRLTDEVTLALNLRPLNWLKATVDYSFINGRWGNLGLGLNLRAGIFNMYILADYIPISFARLNLGDMGNGKDLKIVYTPLHGTGNIPVQNILKELGFENVYVVPEQELPDGNFPTVSYPNPEDPKAFALALELAKKVDADLILATDPDADRLGVYAKDSATGEYIFFTGNMSALFIAEYELSQKKEKGILPENGAMVTTIVSSNLTDAIAKEYNVKLFEVLTGFKYIGEKIKQFEQNNSYEYVFGFEESYGCLVGTHARDKDAIVAVMKTCEAAAFYKSKGLSVVEQMENIYKKYGYYKEGQTALTFKGIEGAEKIKSIMEKLRNNPPMELAGLKVLAFRDYLVNTSKDFRTNETCETGLPKSNVLYFELENNSWCCVRPSGTEPLVRVMIEGQDREYIKTKAENLAKLIEQKLN